MTKPTLRWHRFVAILMLALAGCGPLLTPSPVSTGAPTRIAAVTSAPSLAPARVTATTEVTAPPTEEAAPTPTAKPSPEPIPQDTPAIAPRDEEMIRPTAVFEVDSGQVLALVNGTLIDGTGADPLPNVAVVIQGGRILAVGPESEVGIPDRARVIDVQGATILPGFINAHVHQGFDGQKLAAWAQGGVTTVRDLGAYPADDLFDRRDALLRDNRYARLVAAGPIVTVPDGYPIVPWGAKALTVSSPEDAASKTGQLLDAGADVIKIALDSGAIFNTDIPVLTAEEAAAIVQVAHGRGTLVSAHVTTTQDLRRALDAGVDDMAHMVTDFLPAHRIQAMLEGDVYWVPTLELYRRVGYFERRAVANLGSFVEAGGQVALGTDYAGYNAVFDLGMPTTEIELMQEAGMTPMQIIVAATQNAAHVCNLDHELGTLEAGKIADVLIVNGDPLADIHALTQVRMVIHNGVVIRDEESKD
jgi:imidazolonepropionase-like amidohydrolase